MYYQVGETNLRIMGSMHMFPAGRSEVPAWVDGAFEWADKIVFEADGKESIPFFKAESNASLRNELTPASWAYLSSIWPTDGPLKDLNTLHPWAALLVAPALVVKTEHGIEPRFQHWAAEESMPTSFLEGPEQFAEMMGAVPLQDIQAAIDLFIDNAATQHQLVDEIYSAWLTGSPSKTYEVASKAPSFCIQSLRETVLDKRNKLWAPAVNALLANERRTLVVVGALHLHGKFSLLNLIDLPSTQLLTNG